MKLELGNFYVKDIVFGDKTKYENGILTVDKEDCLACQERPTHHGGRFKDSKAWRHGETGTC